jgi:chromosome partitioning protein
MKTLVVANQKGGVGKSTLTVHLAYAALEAGKRVLLVDMDKQGNLSLTFESKNESERYLVASSLYDETPTDTNPELIQNNLAIIRADPGLLAIDRADKQVVRHPALALRRYSEDYDLCLIDTPPLLGLRLFASLTAADYVVTPVSIGLYELAGVADLLETIKVVRTKGYNPHLRHVGILPIKINCRSNEERQALEQFRAKFGSAFLPEILPERAPVRKAIANRRPVWFSTQGDSHYQAAKEWRAACESILRRIEL